MFLAAKRYAAFHRLTLCALPAAAQTGWNKATQGDLANCGLAPTTITVADGDNLISGHTGGGGRDYLTFTVPAAQSWLGLQLLPGTTFSGSVSFLGLQAGPQVTVCPQAFSAAGLLGWVPMAMATLAATCWR